MKTFLHIAEPPEVIKIDYKNAALLKAVLKQLKSVRSSLFMLNYSKFDYPKYETCMAKKADTLKNGDLCHVVGGTHAGKSGTVEDLNLSKTGHITITVRQKDGARFKTLGKNVEVIR